MFILYLYLGLTCIFQFSHSATGRSHTDIARIPEKIPIREKSKYSCNALSYLDPPFWFCKDINFPSAKALQKYLGSSADSENNLHNKHHRIASLEYEKITVMYFIHITKAAGTTMNDLLKTLFQDYYGKRNFYEGGPEYPTKLQVKQNFLSSRLNYPALVSLERNWGTGDVLFGVDSDFNRYHSNRTRLIHILFLREPIARTKSHWTHHERKKNHNQGCSKFKGKFDRYFFSCCSSVNVSKFCGCALDCRQFINFQTYMTSNKVVSSKEPHVWNQEIPSVRSAKRSFRQEYKNTTGQQKLGQVLQDCLKNIDKSGFVGIVEHMRPSICLFYDTFHFDKEFSKFECETPHERTVQEVSKLNYNKLSSAYKVSIREEKLFRDINTVDAVLYDYSKKLFWDRFKAMLHRRGITQSWSTYFDESET